MLLDTSHFASALSISLKLPQSCVRSRKPDRSDSFIAGRGVIHPRFFRNYTKLALKAYIVDS